MASDLDEAKQALRSKMRAVRRGLLDRPERSARILQTLTQRPDVLAASKIMVFDPLASEPDMAPLIAWCEMMGKQSCLPEDTDLDPTWPDVIVVPGLALLSMAGDAGRAAAGTTDSCHRSDPMP